MRRIELLQPPSITCSNRTRVWLFSSSILCSVGDLIGPDLILHRTVGRPFLGQQSWPDPTDIFEATARDTQSTSIRNSTRDTHVIVYRVVQKKIRHVKSIRLGNMISIQRLNGQFHNSQAPVCPSFQSQLSKPMLTNAVRLNFEVPTQIVKET